MPSVKQMRAAYMRAKKKIQEDRAKLETKRIELQLACPHSDLMEVDYRSDPFGGHNHSPPWRVCKDCGFAEEGWNCGYQVLRTRNEVPRVTRELGMSFLEGVVHRNSLFIHNTVEQVLRGEADD